VRVCVHSVWIFKWKESMGEAALVTVLTFNVFSRFLSAPN